VIRRVCLLVGWFVRLLMCSLVYSFVRLHPATGCDGRCAAGGSAAGGVVVRARRRWRPTRSFQVFGRPYSVAPLSQHVVCRLSVTFCIVACMTGRPQMLHLPGDFRGPNPSVPVYWHC